MNYWLLRERYQCFRYTCKFNSCSFMFGYSHSVAILNVLNVYKVWQECWRLRHISAGHASVRLVLPIPKTSCIRMVYQDSGDIWKHYREIKTVSGSLFELHLCWNRPGQDTSWISAPVWAARCDARATQALARCTRYFQRHTLASGHPQSHSIIISRHVTTM